jgi:hypothetical protein
MSHWLDNRLKHPQGTTARHKRKRDQTGQRAFSARFPKSGKYELSSGYIMLVDFGRRRL